MDLRPPARPRKSADAVKALALAGGVDPHKFPLYLVGIRGYYHDDHGDNRRGIYDDALFLISPNLFAAFNANTDPTISREGVAVLEPGLWWYKLGIHGLSRPLSKRYEALVQAAEVTVRRDRTGLDTGEFGINIHRGQPDNTSSLGCQTIVPDQWDNFIGLIRQELKRIGDQHIIPYSLHV